MMEDIRVLKNHCEAIYHDFGIKNVEVDRSILWAVLATFPQILVRNAATPNPSLFKRASAITISFMIKSPMAVPFKTGTIPAHIRDIANHQNAIGVFEYCRKALFGAVIYKTEKKADKLEHPIDLSLHSYCDVIHAIAQIKNDEPFHLLSLIYEMMTYRWNPNASYK